MSADTVSVSLYSTVDGRFVGRFKRLPRRHLDTLKAAEGYAWMIGIYDPRTQCVDLATSTVVNYERPEAEVRAEALEKENRKVRARTQFLEAQQIRALREAVLELLPADHPLHIRLKKDEDEIAQSGIRKENSQ
jgi:hypothetical protein